VEMVRSSHFNDPGRGPRDRRRKVTGRTIDVGDRAPEFDLRRTFEQNVRLAELTSRGPVLVAFYVFDFGPI